MGSKTSKEPRGFATPRKAPGTPTKSEASVDTLETRATLETPELESAERDATSLDYSWPLREMISLVSSVLRVEFVDAEPTARSREYDEALYRTHTWRVIHPLLTSTSGMLTTYTTRAVAVPTAPPSVREIEAFITDYARRGLVSSESLTVSLIYVQRLLATGAQLLPGTWRPILLGALILSTKMVDDLVTFNKEFESRDFGVHKVTLLEMACLKALDYRLYVGPKEYARYHFALRKLAETQPARQLVLSRVRGAAKTRSLRSMRVV